ncbi:MAG TPA: hypothetical protein VEZ90_13965 [Blastocatellia bacterium]|nr:hypothetical protein [Blastocatellia bacterium]
MPLASEFQDYDRTNTLWGRETWDALFGDAARSSQEIADSVALLLKDVLLATAGGRKNIEKLRNTAKDGIEWVWPYTKEHELSFIAFLYSIEGLTVGGYEPIDLLERAIAVADADLAGQMFWKPAPRTEITEGRMQKE